MDWDHALIRGSLFDLRGKLKAVVVVILLVVLAKSTALTSARASSISGEIRHVVILVMENEPYEK